MGSSPADAARAASNAATGSHSSGTAHLGVSVGRGWTVQAEHASREQQPEQQLGSVPNHPDHNGPA